MSLPSLPTEVQPSRWLANRDSAMPPSDWFANRRVCTDLSSDCMTTQTTQNNRFIPGLAKLPEKRKITQTEKRQRDCKKKAASTIVANVIGGISRNGRSMHVLLTTTKIMQYFAVRVVPWGWARYQYNCNPEKECIRDQNWQLLAGLLRSMAD